MSEGAPTDPLTTRTAGPRATAAGEHASETLADAERIEAASMIGRFTILDIVGAGGMGQVYAAYDPQLDRRVALKVLHTPDDEVARQRLVREAQALARLSHPNVVGVHEVGAHEGRVFVAMEFVEGETLKDWARSHAPGEPDRMRRALELLLHAGRGLAAAHAAGLVHRDVKPGNILVGRDGRVRVADFGLARADEDAPAGTLERSLSSSQTDSALAGAALTRTGMIAGTPAYMAPEQLAAEPIGPATDQFGFCVTAWEVLFGHRPFPLGAIIALLEAIRDGRLERPESIHVPPEVEAALRKGLAYRPKRRHASMNALLSVFEDALRRIDGDRVPARARRRWIVGAVLGALAIGAGAYALQSEGPSCARDLEAFDGVWDDARRSAIESAAFATNAPFAEATWTRLAPALDAWRDEWLDAHVDACQATHVRGEQSSELLDLRVACLHDRRMHFAAFLDVLAGGDIDALAHADEGFAGLPSISRCADSRYVRAGPDMPEDPAIAARIEALDAKIVEADARLAAADYDTARELADAATREAQELAHGPTEARARLVSGKLWLELQRGPTAEVELQQAYLLARRSDDRLTAADAARLMILATGVSQYRLEDGRWWADLAEIEAARIDDDRLVMRMHVARSRLLAASGDLGTATAEAEKAVAMQRTDDPGHAHALMLKGSLLVSRGHLTDARDVLEKARSLLTERLGAEHPAMAPVFLEISRAKRFAGDLEGSEEAVDTALAIVERALGPRHVSLRAVLDERADVDWLRGDVEATFGHLRRAKELDVPRPLGSLSLALLEAREGNTWAGVGNPERAEASFRRALDMLRAEVGERHYLTARHRIGLAAALSASGRRAEAEVELRQGLTLGEEILGRDHPEIAVVHDEIALIREQSGDLEGAFEHAKRALELTKDVHGARGFATIRAEANMCGLLGKLARPTEAVAHCEAALDITRETEGIDPLLVASVHNNLGAALVASDRLQEAAAAYQVAHDTWRDRFGPDSVQVAVALANLAEVRERSGDGDAAREGYTRSAAIRETAAGPTHPSLVVPLLGIARTALASNDATAAVEAGRRALAICESHPTDPLTLARTREQLALALWDLGRRRDALESARRALESLQAAGPRGVEDHARVHAWIERAGG